MGKTDKQRVEIMGRVSSGDLTLVGASVLLELCVRQVRRLLVRYEASPSSMAHAGRGRAGPGKTSAEVCARVVTLRREKYAMCNDRDFAERLAADEGIVLGREKVRQLSRAAGIGPLKVRRKPKHRARRERRAREGEMIQWDGSTHDWLEGRGPKLCLMGAVDDATGELLPGAQFYMQECGEGYLRILFALAETRGLPHTIYGDKHSSLRRNDDYWTIEEERNGKQSPTHVQRAIRALGIEQIDAHSPQAKGRVERGWGTHQDRLVAALTLANAATIDEANEVLQGYLKAHNRRFKKLAKDPEAAWRTLPQHMSLVRTCAYRYEATVDNANTVRVGGKAGVVIDIPPGPHGRSYAKAKVEVFQTLDGSWLVDFKGQCIAKHASTALGDLRALRHRTKNLVGRARKEPTRIAA